jgi:hypothetical protein
MKGFVIAEEGHVVQLVAPVDFTGGKTAQAFAMDEYQHASVIILLGVQGGAGTKILVNQCTDASGSNPVAIPFNIYKQETAGVSHDVLGARTAVAAAGYTPSANAGIFYVIELDANELADGSPYVQVQFTNGANSDIGAMVAVLSGARYSEVQSPTQTT